MTWINKARAVRVVVGIAVSAVIAFGMAAGTAQARWDHRDEHHWNGGWHGGWSGGYYGAPPVVYGDPYSYGYYPPPGVGINVGGVHIGIR
jgi:hypothetical protein